MTPAEHHRQEFRLETAMTTLCPACWRAVPHDALQCPHCSANIAQLHEREFRDKLLAALTHPIADTVIRAAVALAARHDPEASRAIETAMQRFPTEPHVLAGLLNALMVVGDEEAKRIALDALGHRSFIVRRAAAQVLEHIGQPASESTCADRKR
jgi:HEAT repeat protein